LVVNHHATTIKDTAMPCVVDLAADTVKDRGSGLSWRIEFCPSDFSSDLCTAADFRAYLTDPAPGNVPVGIDLRGLTMTAIEHYVAALNREILGDADEDMPGKAA
jgi:hypothetical protein